jgi:predicted adenine nucleotide alpha hydrolase (AANH) superfamily ATPase/VanZ family protein
MKQHTILKKIEDLALPVVKVSLALVWAVFIFAILERPMSAVESDAKGFTVSDKFVHVFLFGFLLWLVLNAIKEWRGRISRFGYIISVALVFGFAYLCEYLQRFVPTRTSSLTDLSFGALGIILSLFLYLYSSSRRRPGSRLGNTKPKLLVHLCCGPCGSALSDELKKDYDVSLFFANSNVDNPQEFKKRADNAKKVAKEYDLPLITEDYNHKEWLDLIKGLEDEPERGGRCLKCYEYRLKQTADKAEELGFDYFTTSLSVSPYKDGQAIIHLGRTIGAKIKPKFLDRHFGHAEGFRKSVAKAKELGLYRQKYCGCEFSKK